MSLAVRAGHKPHHGAQVESAVACSGPAQTRQVALPHDAAVEEVDVDPSLAFLNSHVNAALQHGAAPYLREEERVSMGVVRPSASGAEPDHLHQLRFTAYEAPKPATPQAVSIVQPHEPVAPGLSWRHFSRKNSAWDFFHAYAPRNLEEQAKMQCSISQSERALCACSMSTTVCGSHATCPIAPSAPSTVGTSTPLQPQALHLPSNFRYIASGVAGSVAHCI